MASKKPRKDEHPEEKLDLDEDLDNQIDEEEIEDESLDSDEEFEEEEDTEDDSEEEDLELKEPAHPKESLSIPPGDGSESSQPERIRLIENTIQAIIGNGCIMNMHGSRYVFYSIKPVVSN